MIGFIIGLIAGLQPRKLPGRLDVILKIHDINIRNKILNIKTKNESYSTDVITFTEEMHELIKDIKELK